MLPLYEKIENLCTARSTNITVMCKEIGVPRSVLSDFKAGRSKTVGIKHLEKIAEHFDVSIDYLVGKEKSPSEKSDRPSEDDIKIALFGGDGEVTDEMWEEAVFAVQLIKDRHKRKQNDK